MATKQAQGHGKSRGRAAPKYPRHSVEKALRIPRAILMQNAGKDCSDEDAARFLGLKLSGPVAVEISSGLKYGFLDRPAVGQLQLTERAKKAIRPQKASDAVEALREAVLGAPALGDVSRAEPW